jgi:hypothetical protein
MTQHVPEGGRSQSLNVTILDILAFRSDQSTMQLGKKIYSEKKLFL